jgi:hypothetical protein
MTWSFLTPKATAPGPVPVNNAEDLLLVEPNARGGWSLRFQGDPLDSQLGNYATPEDAARVARSNCQHVRVVMPEKQQVTAISGLAKSPEARMANLLMTTLHKS